MIRNAIRLGRISGIEIGLDYSWFVVFALVTVSFATNVLPQFHVSWSSSAYWITSLAISLLFFASILAHELGHSLVAIRTGTPVRSITLFIFGGVAGMAREPGRAWHEFLIAIAGPLVSLLLAAGFFGLLQLAPTDTPLSALAEWLSLVNLAVAVFNMLPGFPMDGGRVLRAVLWGIRGDLVWATRIATWVGRGLAYALMAWGAYIAIAWGEWLSGFWRILIATFIHTAAVRSYQQVAFLAGLRRQRVGDLMSPISATPSPDLSVADVLGNDLRLGSQAAWPIVGDGRLLGVLTRDELHAVPWEARGRTRVGELLPSNRRVLRAQMDDTLADVFERFDGQQLIVVAENGRIIGIITNAQLTQAVRSSAQS